MKWSEVIRASVLECDAAAPLSVANKWPKLMDNFIAPTKKRRSTSAV